MFTATPKSISSKIKYFMLLCHVNETERRPAGQQSPYTITTRVITTKMNKVMNKKGITQTTHSRVSSEFTKEYDKLRTGWIACCARPYVCGP